MPLPSSGRLSIQDIKNEFGDPDGDGQFKFSEYYRGDSSSRPVKNISRNSNVATTGEIRASQFYDAAGLFLPPPTSTDSGWPGDNEAGSPAGIPGDGTVNPIWQTELDVTQSFGNPECSCYISFKHEPANSRIKIVWSGTTSGSYQITHIGYYNYVGLETATWEVMYNATNEATTSGDDYIPWGPLPSNDGLDKNVYYSIPTSGSRFFGWCVQATQARAFTITRVFGLSITIRATLGSDIFTSVYQPLGFDLGSIIMQASRSPYQVPGGGK